MESCTFCKSKEIVGIKKRFVRTRTVDFIDVTLVAGVGLEPTTFGL